MSGKVGGVFVGIVLVILLIGGFMCAERVPAGYVGVVYKMNGGIDDETLSQGWHLVAPTKKVTLYSIGIEQSYLTSGDDGDSEKDDSFEAPSKDGKGMRVDETFTYRYDENRVAEIFTRFKGRSGKDVLRTFIRPNVMSWTKEVTPRYYLTEIIGEQRGAVNIALTEYLQQKFEPYGIIIESASLIDVNVDKETDKAIQKKIQAQQELEVAKINKQTASVEAEKEKEVALIQAEKDKETAVINAEKARIKAEGEAQAQRIKAEAEAEANKKVAGSLTPELIESKKIEKWNGSVPQIQGGSTPIVDLRGDNNE